MEDLIFTIIALAILLLYPTWRVFKRAGLNPALSLTVLFPYGGFLLAGVLLAVMPWKIRADQGVQS